MHQLTFRPHYSGRKPRRGLTSQKSPSCPACWRTAAWLQCPERANIQGCFFLHSGQSQSHLDEETGLVTVVTGDAMKKKKKKQPIDGDANADGNGGRARSGDGLITDAHYSDGSHSLQFK